MPLKTFWFATVLVAATYAFAQTNSEVSASLVNHQVVLRNYYTDPSLAFDSDGTLLSKGTPGFGPSDGLVYVQEVDLQADKVILKGDRPVPIFDKSTGGFRLADVGRRVTLSVNLPPDHSAGQSVPPALSRILMNQKELGQMKCSAEEEREFREKFLNPPFPVKRAGKSNTPPPTTLDQLPQYCLPFGERAYFVSPGIKSPKAISVVDPDYTDAARKAKKEGTAALLVVVGIDGRPTTISIVRPIGEGLDAEAVAALSKWRFQPAKFGDQPVPVVITVEMNFKLF